MALLHHLAVFTLLVCAAMSIGQLSRPFDLRTARLLHRLDSVNAMAATLVLLVGVARVVYLEKGASYYLHSGPFLAKMLLYGVASVLSLVPTLELRRWRQPLAQGTLPSISAQRLATLRVVWCGQLACLAAMAVCAMMAARGLALPLGLA